MLSRRQVLAGFGATAVVGFNPTSRSWISVAEAAAGLFDRVPPLDGTLVTDPAALAPFATDLGNIVHNAPIAVLHPGSARDVEKMVRFCRIHRIKVGARGQGHQTFGQAQVGG